MREKETTPCPVKGLTPCDVCEWRTTCREEDPQGECDEWDELWEHWDEWLTVKDKRQLW